MGKWTPFPFVGGAYTDSALSWANQDTVNYLPVLAERGGTRGPDKLAKPPGARVFASVGTGPHRGARDVEGKAFVVSGTKLYQVKPDGTSTLLGTIPGTGPVSMTHNQVADGNQLVIGNGSSGYVYNTVDSTFVQITDEGFPGARTVDYIGQVVVGVELQRRFWFHSDSANALEYSTLDRYEAESSPDRLVGVVVSHNDVLVFGERTIEQWSNSPTETRSFQRNDGMTIERGCASEHTILRLDNTVFFLADNMTVCKIEGGSTPVPVSTRAMERAFENADPRKAFAFTWEDGGHAVYYITVDGKTWGWDVTQREWHRRDSAGLDRWRFNTMFKWNNNWYAGDYTNGNMYRLDWSYALEDCDPLDCRRRTAYVHNSGNRVIVRGVRIEVDSGAEVSICTPYVPPTPEPEPDITIERGIKPKVVSWWDFEDSLTDLARGGNNQFGTVTYETNDTATGKRLAQGTVPMSTATNYGFNLFKLVTEYSHFSFGARLSTSTLANVTRLITVGTDSGAAVTGVVSIGIVAGKWQAVVYGTAGPALLTLTSTTNAAVDVDFLVGVNGVSGASNDTISLWINGVQEASGSVSAGLLQVNGSYVIGTREGSGYRPRVAQMFWSHDSLTSDEWLYLHNNGNKRFYADFGSVSYGTTHDAYLASLLAAKTAAVFALNATSGSTAADSGPNPIGAANLVGGASYSSAIDPPPGFSSADGVVLLDGVNGRIENGTDTPLVNVPATMSLWMYQTSDGAASESYFTAGILTAGQPSQERRRISQGANATELVTTYFDSSGNTAASNTTATLSRLNSWKMLTYGGYETTRYATILNGIMVGSGFYASPFPSITPGKYIIGSEYNGTNAVAGYVSRSFIIPQGNLLLPQLAKLYDLGMGIG